MFQLPRLLLLVALFAFPLAGCGDESPKERAQAFVNSAVEKRDAGKVDAAIIELKNALQITPENGKARRILGELYLSRGEGQSAVKELRRAIEYGEDALQVKAGLARALLITGDAGGVLELVPAPGADADLSTDGRREFYGLRAQALLTDGQSQAAADLSSRLLEAGETFEARLTLARLHAAGGQHATALEHVERALAQHPEDTEALWVKGTTLMANGQLDRAMTVLEKAREKDWRPVRVDLAVMDIALKQGRHEHAWAVLDELVKHVGNDPRVKYFQSLRALSEERYPEARRLAEEVSGQYPEFTQASYVAGAASLKEGNFEIARRYLQNFVNANPQNRKGRTLLAQAWKGLGEPEEASRVLAAGQGGAPGPQYARAATASDADPLAEPGLETPEGKRGQVRAILSHLQKQEFDTAMEKARALEEELPDSALPLQLQGVILWTQGKKAEAIERMQAAAERAPGDVTVAVNLARMHRARGQADAAIEVLGPAMEANPDNATLKVEAARVYASRNDSDRVRALLEEALAANPGAVDARAYLARFHLLQGRPREALDVVEAAPDGSGSSGALLEVEGRAQEALGNRGEALEAYKKLAEAAPDNAQGYLRAGEVLLAMNRPEEAADFLEKARARMDRPRQAGINLACALMDSGQGERAGTLIAELEEKYPKVGDVAILRGNYALRYQEDPDAAVAAFEKALELEPTSTRVVDLAQLLTRLGRMDAAIGRLTDWRSSHEPSVAVDSNLAQLQLVQGNLGEAESLYRSLVDRRPDNPAFRNNLAWLLGERGELDGALKHARKAVDLLPGDPGVRDTLGMVLLKRGDTAEAREQLSQAAETAPGRPDIQINYAEALVAAGKDDEAEAVLGRVESAELSADLKDRIEGLRARMN